MAMITSTTMMKKTTTINNNSQNIGGVKVCFIIDLQYINNQKNDSFIRKFL